MKKTVIVYASNHQGNTRRLVQAIAERYDLTLVDANCQQQVDLSGFDRIGFASGIDFGSVYRPVLDFLENNLPEGKQVFFLYTCARVSSRFTKEIREKALERNGEILGEYGCKGYNTYGPWKLVGGINKGHPNREELELAVAFYDNLGKAD